MRGWAVLCVCAFWNIVTTQPINTENGYLPPKSSKCCPCPDDQDPSATVKSGHEFLRVDEQNQRSDQEGSSTIGNGVHAALAGLDDCPCRFRAADSSGSASVFFPTALRALQPFVSTDNTKEESKPLLHPEVGLASSVLHTLREATDEEYEDALARDAARSVTKNSDFDGVAEESSPNIVTILVNPKSAENGDDFITEATNNQESRCIHAPSEKFSSPQVAINPPNLLSDILKLPLRRQSILRNTLDMDNSASNTKEHVISPAVSNAEVSHGARLKSFLDPLNILSNNVKSDTNDVNPSDSFKSAENVNAKIKPFMLPKLSDILQKIDLSRAAAPSLFKINKIDDTTADGSEHISNAIVDSNENTRNNNDILSRLENASKKIFDLNKSIISKATRPNTSNVPHLNLISKGRDSTTNLLTEAIENLENTINKNFLNIQNLLPSSEKRAELTSESNDKHIATEIIDTLPSPSETQKTHLTPSCFNDTGPLEINVEINNPKTEIIDTIKGGSDFGVGKGNQETQMIDETLTNNNKESFETFSAGHNNNAHAKESDQETSEDLNNQVFPGENFNTQDMVFDTSNNMFSVAKEVTPASNNNGLFTDSADDMVSSRNEPSENTEDEINVSQKEFTLRPTDQEIHSNSESLNKLSIDDLQTMSDTLLDKEKQLIDAIARSNNTTKTSNIRSELIASKEITDSVSNESVESVEHINKNNKECPSNVNTSDSNESTEHKEMMAGASEPFIQAVKPNNILRSSLLPIVQPSHLVFNPLENLFNGPTIRVADIFKNSHSMFKTPNIFNSEARKAITNFSGLDKNESKESSSFLSSASAPKLSSVLPPLPTLEDLNLDIFQINPFALKESHRLFAPLPKLNLNSFKAKLALPTKLGLKPVLLESSVGNNKGILGAALTFGKKQKENGRSSSSITVPDIFGNGIELPKLNELRETLLENTHNLLSTPLEVTHNNMIDDALRSTQVLSENLTVHAKNVVKDLEKNMKSTLKKAGISNDGILGNPLTARSDIYEAIARSHDDWNDRLKGIHYDLTDRLESFRNNILEQIPSFGSTMDKQSSSQKMSQASLRSKIKSKERSSDDKKPSGSFYIGSKAKKAKPIKPSMLTSPSITKPRVVETLQSSSSKKTPQTIHGIKDQRFLGIFNRPQKTLLKSKPLASPKAEENKVKITFITTPRPSFKSSSTNDPNQFKNIPSLKHIPKLNDLKGRYKISNRLEDSRNNKPNLPKVPFKTIEKARVTSPNQNLKSNSGTTKIPLGSRLRSLSQKNSVDSNFKQPKDGSQNIFLSKKSNLPILPKPAILWPRTIDDSFLTKVREALQSRLANFGSRNNKNDRKFGSIFDMERSASNNLETIHPNQATPDNTRELNESKTMLHNANDPVPDMERSPSNTIEVGPTPLENNSNKTSTYSCNMVCTKHT